MRNDLAVQPRKARGRAQPVLRGAEAAANRRVRGVRLLREQLPEVRGHDGAASEGRADHLRRGCG